ncbi:MAG: YidH family protein [Jatrophihabitans sp.]
MRADDQPDAVDQDMSEEPDYRFSLANERTFLSWVRTALAMLAAGVGVVRFAPGGELAWLRTTLAVLIAVLGLSVAAGAYTQWRAVDRSIRKGAGIPHSPLLPVIGGVLTLIGIGVVVLVIAG